MRAEREIRRRLELLENQVLRPLDTFEAVEAWRRAIRTAEAERDMLRWVLCE